MSIAPEPKNLDVLQNLESAVIEVWRSHPEMSDHVVGRAYEAVFERYRTEMRGHQVSPCKLTGLDREVFDALFPLCEWRLGRAETKGMPAGLSATIPVAELVDCLRDLKRSVERHTKNGGRQGYLQFVAQFV